MTKLTHTDLNSLLNEIAQSLDIPDGLFEAAERSYQAVGTWLGAGDSPLAPFSPQIYPQGSFCLGTVTKPPTDADEYDLDLVFELALSKYRISQQQLKRMVGDRLKAHETYRKMLDEEGRRCWTLQYADSAQFHQDILPAVPDHNTHPILQARGVPASLAETSIAITDNTLPNFSRMDPDWPRGNPKGYAAWFRQQMIVRFEELRKRFAEAQKARLEEVPDYRVKTPLQRCVQLLKRHRDILFANDPVTKPTSIILTTLAASAYRNEAQMTEALFNIVNGMPNYVSTIGGVTCVPNPVDPAENFADRWQDHPEREPAFRTWLRQVRGHVESLLTCDDLDEIQGLLAVMFGEKVATTAVSRHKEVTLSRVGSASAAVTSSRPLVDIRPMKPWGWK